MSNRSLRKCIEDEAGIFEDMIVPIGYLWDKTWLEAYSHDDRGYEELRNPLYPTISSTFNRLRKVTSSAVEEIPAMEKELMIMHKLYKEFMKPTKEIIEKVQKIPEERENKLMLLPEEWINVTNNLSRIRVYFSYRNGSNLIKKWYFIDRKPVKDLVEICKGSLVAFERKWNEEYYIDSKEKFGFVTYCSIDSHDDTVLPKVLKEKEPSEILLNEIPEKGIDRVIFNPSVEVQKRIEHAIRTRTHKHAMCTVNSLRNLLDRERIKNYNREILRLSGLLDYLSYVF